MTKKRKIRPMLIVEIAFLVFLAVGAVICFSDMFKVWHIFTEKRIETLEEIFDTNFPDNTEFEYYSYVYQFQAGEAHNLYIKNIADPESFCRNCTNMPIEFMANIKNAKAIEYGDYTEEAAEKHIKRLLAEEINWHKEKRFADFLCICKSDGYQNVYLYFSKNKDGRYDVKMEIQ